MRAQRAERAARVQALLAEIDEAVAELRRELLHGGRVPGGAGGGVGRGAGGGVMDTPIKAVRLMMSEVVAVRGGGVGGCQWAGR